MDLSAFALVRVVVVRGGIEPPTFRFSGAFATSLYVAGRGLTGHLAAQTMAGCRLMSPDACRRWLPVWLPILVSAAHGRDADGAQTPHAKHLPPRGQPTLPG